MLLKESGIKLTDLEKDCLNCIRMEGDFFEGAGGNETVREFGSAFLGWEIYESEVPGCRGAIASLVKKGIIDAYDADGNGTIGYSINYELEFKEDGWTIDFGDEEEVETKKEDITEAASLEVNEDFFARDTKKEHRLLSLEETIKDYGLHIDNKKITIIDKIGNITYEGEVDYLFKHRCKTLLNTTVSYFSITDNRIILNRKYLPIKIK